MTQRLRWWREAWRAQRTLLREAGIGAAVLLSIDLGAASAQSAQVQVSYDVEFSTTGAQMARGGNCTGGAGFDKLSGTIMGFEPAPAHEDNTYEGILKRDTQLTFATWPPIRTRRTKPATAR